jgi:hypothetical protein
MLTVSSALSSDSFSVPMPWKPNMTQPFLVMASSTMARS